MTDRSSSILNQSVIPRSSDEAHRLINMPWQPPPPVYDHDQMDPPQPCRLSNEDFNRMFDMVMSNIFVFVLIIIALLIFGCCWLYAEIYGSVESLLKFHLRKLAANLTKTE